MRVITGTARGRRLKMPGGGATRPAMDRVKASLFSILGHRIVGCSFLDLFAGSGSLGIEALSRGADIAIFVDASFQCVKTIKENLSLTKLQDQGKVYRADCLKFLRDNHDTHFDIVCIDPPYSKGLIEPVLDILPSSGAFTSETLFIIERRKRDLLNLHLRPFIRQTDERIFGDTVLTFFVLAEKQP